MPAYLDTFKMKTDVTSWILDLRLCEAEFLDVSGEKYLFAEVESGAA